MLLQQRKKIEDYIVELLARFPNLEIYQIWEFIVEQEEVTQRAVYKALKKLEEEGIVSRIGKSVSLSLPWIVELLEFAENTYAEYSKPNFLESILPDYDEEFRFHFHSLKALDEFCGQLVVAIHSEKPTSPMYIWHPHQWFELVSQRREQRLKESIRISEFQRYVVVGGDTYLDHYFLKNLPNNYIFSTAESPFHKERNRYYAVMEDLLMTITLDRKATQFIDEFYDKITSEDDLNARKILSLINLKIRAKVIVERDSKKAPRIRRKFERFFGT